MDRTHGCQQLIVERILKEVSLPGADPENAADGQKQVEEPGEPIELAALERLVGWIGVVQVS